MSDNDMPPYRRYKTTFEGFPDFRTVERPDPGDFEISEGPCGCRHDKCDGPCLRATVDIAGDRWSVDADWHTKRVRVHRENFQKKNVHPVPLNRSPERAQRDAFVRFLEKLGWPSGRDLPTEAGR